MKVFPLSGGVWFQLLSWPHTLQGDGNANEDCPEIVQTAVFCVSRPRHAFSLYHGALHTTSTSNVPSDKMYGYLRPR